MPDDCPAGIEPPEANDENVKKFFDFNFSYYRIRSLSDDPSDVSVVATTVVKQMCACIAEGYPIIFGFTMYKNVDFDKAKNWKGDVFLPEIHKLESLGATDGGHAVLAVGYDHDTKRFRVRNSWGST